MYKIFQSYAFKMVVVYLICIMSHFAAAHLYTYFCVPFSFYGFFISPFMTLSPQCQALRWIVYNSGTTINLMWFMLANLFVQKIGVFTTTTE